MSQLNFIESNRGGKLAVVNGFIFTLKQRTKTNTHWRCSSYQSLKCPATIKTYGNELVEEKGEHNHEMESGKSEAKKVVNSLKVQAIENTLWMLTMLCEGCQFAPSKILIDFEKGAI